MTRRALLAFLLVGCSTGAMPSADGGGADVPRIPGADSSAADGGGVTPCDEDFECDDRVACTIDRCEDNACANTPCIDCCEEGLSCVVGFGCGMAPLPCEEDADCRDEARCTLDSCDDGACRHRPQSALCEEGEICLAALGCIPEPPTSCESVADCEVGSVCVAEWSCQPEFGCQFVSARDCDDDDACTTDTCSEEAEGCVHTPLDADGDGNAPTSCGGDDCDDADPARAPDATEVCDGDDEDCDDEVDEGCCPAGESCTTSCDTTGAIVCETGGPRCVGVEQCNGLDDDCDDLPDDGFACVLGSSAACNTLCGSVGTRACLGDCSLDGCVPPAEVCNGLDDNCNTACDEGLGCCAGTTRACTTLGFFAGTASCPSTCGDWNVSGCTDCGNAEVDAGEQCDATDLDGASCTTVPGGFGGGTLRCTAGCRFDTGGCTLCGNGRIDPGEQCDGSNLNHLECDTVPGGGFDGGDLACNSNCTFDTSECTGTFDPNGLYSITPINFMCLGGFIAVNLTTLTFTDNGSVLSVPFPRCGGATMTGGSAADGTIDVCCVYPGTCTETSCLRGSFTGPDAFTGTLTLEFAGGSSCFNCMSQSWPVTGTR